MDEFDRGPATGVLGTLAILVFRYSPRDVGRIPGVERPVRAFEDVDVMHAPSVTSLPPVRCGQVRRARLRDTSAMPTFAAQFGQANNRPCSSAKTRAKRSDTWVSQ